MTRVDVTAGGRGERLSDFGGAPDSPRWNVEAGSSELPMRGLVGGKWPLIGRASYLDAIALALAQPEQRGVVLAGPAGVGKSRLAAECRAIAERLGFRCAAVTATAAAASIPLGALAPLLPRRRVRGTVRSDLIRWAAEAVAGDPTPPLLLAIDDAHLLDDSSATVIHQIAASNAAFLVLTMRSSEMASDALRLLWKDELVLRLDVRPLSATQTEQLVRAALGDTDGATLRDLYAASQGNPLFIRELILGAVDAGVLVIDRGLWRLTRPLSTTPRLAELVEARLADLDEDQRAALELLAVGEPLPMHVLDSQVSLTVLDRLDRNALLAIDYDIAGPTVRLAHPLHGEVVRARLTPLRSLAHNRRLADATEGAVASGEFDPTRAAIFRLDGGGRADPSLMLDAARRAFFAHDDVLAERLAIAACGARCGIAGAILLSQVLGATGRHRERVALLRGPDVKPVSYEERAKVAMELASALVWGLGRQDEAAVVLDAAIDALPAGAWRNELLAMRASCDLWFGRPLDALTRVEPVIDHATGRGFVEGAIAAVPALSIVGRADEAVALADRAFAVHLGLAPDEEVLSPPGIHAVTRLLALIEAGHLAEASALATTGYEVAVATRDRFGQAWFALLHGRLDLLTGALSAAHRHFVEASAMYEELGEAGPRRWALAGQALAAALRGETEQAVAAIALLDATPSPMAMVEPDVLRARAWTALVAGDRALAVGLLREAGDMGEQVGALGLAAAAWHDLVRVGSLDPAADRLRATAAAVQGPLAPARVAHADGLQAGSGSGARLADAAEAFEAAGAILFAAEASAAAAAAFRADSQCRVAERWAHRAAALAGACEGARTPALGLAGSAAALTQREREVASLAASGLASKEIAARLGLSRRTVDNHLQRAYDKLGVSSRAELTEALSA